jgi:hypothetical protein
MRKRLRPLLSVAAVGAVAAASLALGSGAASQAATSGKTHEETSAKDTARVVHYKPGAFEGLAGRNYPSGKHMHINCAYSSAMCTELGNSKSVFGYYVGHDEPSMLFDSNTPGSGNHMRYNFVLPKDPSASNPNQVNKSYEFELSGADWLGMAICDTQSYPEQLKTCPADSDGNIRDPAFSPKHVGQAYMELQFYPPGWVQWPTWAVAVGASSCNPTEWCAALNIDSLSLNPVTGQSNNTACLDKVGEEYVNFAFVTKNGKATGPANPLDATIPGTFTPSAKDLFMNSGDHIQVSITDTPNGVQTTLNDLTTHQTGSMTASKANGFAQIKFDPTGSGCTAIPYNFHPMYSTSSTKTRVTWAAGSYNVAFDTEIGHFQFCTGPYKIPATEFGLTAAGNPTLCPSGDEEGRGPSASPPDSDDLFCFPGKEGPTYHVTGCTYTNVPGWDGASYQRLWPNGNTKIHPSPFLFTSPLTGPNYTKQYSQTGFETDLPSTEQTCNGQTGAGCTLIPTTDEGQPAQFYPFYTIKNYGGRCYWEFGNDIPGEITNFGQNNQYGTLLQQSYTQQGGGSSELYSDFRNIIPNPCKAT